MQLGDNGRNVPSGFPDRLVVVEVFVASPVAVGGVWCVCCLLLDGVDGGLDIPCGSQFVVYSVSELYHVLGGFRLPAFGGGRKARRGCWRVDLLGLVDPCGDWDVV